jgi:N-methylhydantoinase A
MPPFRLAADVGGTFVDYVLLDEGSGAVTVDKELANGERLASAVLNGLERVIGPVEDLGRIVHGSTLALNTVLQESGAHVGLITTPGFRDTLTLGRGNRRDIYDLFWAPVKALVPRHRRREVGERLSSTGEVIESLDRDGLERELDLLAEYGVDTIAICFLHAHVNPVHEIEAKELVASLRPELTVTASHEVTREWREYERTSSAVINAYVMPKVAAYLDELERGLSSMSFDGDLAVMQSNGGIAPADSSRQVPARTLNSGPAGGVIGGAALAQRLGIRHLICADVGGTSFDVALIEDGRARQCHIAEHNRRPVIAPGIDIVSVGAGGGSVAWVDERGMLAVGPRSAGAMPGPACFGQGGTDLTVTDANLLLGRISADGFLGDRLDLSPDLARDAAAALGDQIGLSELEVAAGALRLVEANMAYAVRAITVEHGKDLREYVLLAYGGGGGLFAGALLRDLELLRVVCPPYAALFSAFGALFADFREDAVEIALLPASAAAIEDVRAVLDRTRDQALTRLAGHGLDAAGAQVEAAVDVRFRGQEHTLTVAVGECDDAERWLAQLDRDFRALHQEEFGHVHDDRDLEIVAFRTRATTPASPPRIEATETRRRRPAPETVREVWFSDENAFRDAGIHQRDALEPGDELAGPVVVQEWNNTIVVEPGQAATVDEYGNLIIERAR